MVQEIVHDTIFLAQKSEPATKEDEQVVIDLLDTLRAHTHECVGMAANMIGVKKNIIAVSAELYEFVMINPQIVSKNKPFVAEEECISVLGEPKKCRRFEEIEVAYLDNNWRPRREKYTGWVAQIIQHEIDHLDGILI